MPFDQPTTIEKKADPLFDFDALRQSGIDLLHQITGEVWTDFNLHDPGVTILEQLCFAITDIAYRGNFSIEEILTNENDTIDFEKNSFFRREDILSSSPITINDLRKKILDEFADKIENVWLEHISSKYGHKYMNGLYKVFVQVKTATTNDARTEQDTQTQIHNSIMSLRNLCENFESITILKPQPIKVKAEIFIKENSPANEVLALIFQKLSEFLNPSITFYNEKDLATTDYSTSDIFSGPLLKRGFIKPEDLNDRRNSLDPTELITAIYEVGAVDYVKSIEIVSSNELNKDTLFTVKNDSYLTLDISTFHQDVALFNGRYRNKTSQNEFVAIYKKNTHSQRRNNKEAAEIATKQKKGKYKNIEQYYSIQNYFPVVYGICEQGLAANASDERRAQAKQLKAYLMLFEQFLANHLSQLAGVKTYFSASLPNVNSTYHFQPLYDVPGAKDILKAYTDKESIQSWGEFKRDRANKYVAALQKYVSSDAKFYEQKNALLDHILSRYNEVLSLYPVKFFNDTYNVIKNDHEDADHLQYKVEYFKSLLNFGKNRTTGCNFLSQAERITTELERKILLLLDIRRCDPDLSNLTREQRKYRWLTSHLSIRGRQLYANNRHRHTYKFPNQSETFFRDAISEGNYVVERAWEHNYHTYYINQSNKEKQIINTHVSREGAVKDLTKFLEHMKAVNINSEGFHMVEHQLFAPSTQSESFGFAYHYGNETEPRLRLDGFVSFERRNEIISTIVTRAKNNTVANERSIEIFLNTLQNLDVRTTKTEHNFSTKQLYHIYVEEIIDELNSIEPNSTAHRSIKMLTKLTDGRIIKEHFFDLQLTIILPSWPARFQDSDFKDFIVDTFKASLPAHITINYKWMSVAGIIEFEKCYADWLNARDKSRTGATLLDILTRDSDLFVQS